MKKSILNFFFKLRELIGVLLFDTLRYAKALKYYENNKQWIYLCNRNESLTATQEDIGVRCDWRWSSQLHAPKIFPSWGNRLMRLSLVQYPIDLGGVGDQPLERSNPEISFIVGHRGRERLPLLLLTLRSIVRQKDVSIECIVVEESDRENIGDKLPSWVRYIHLPTQTKEQPYNRARVFNVGAQIAQGKLLVLHDNDMLVPDVYSRELFSKLESGYQVINLKRFIFYLTKQHTAYIAKTGEITIETVDFILQNLTGGGSLAVEKKSFFDLGGFDESFVGWGGEDIEFWERALTRKVWQYTFLPLIHLWHAPQPGKTPAKETPGMQRYVERSVIPVRDRISELCVKNARYFDEK